MTVRKMSAEGGSRAPLDALLDMLRGKVLGIDDLVRNALVVAEGETALRLIGAERLAIEAVQILEAFRAELSRRRAGDAPATLDLPRAEWDGLKVAHEHFASMLRETVTTIAQIQKRIGTHLEFQDDAPNLAHYERNRIYFESCANGCRWAMDRIQASASQEGSR